MLQPEVILYKHVVLTLPALVFYALTLFIALIIMYTHFLMQS